MKSQHIGLSRTPRRPWALYLFIALALAVFTIGAVRGYQAHGFRLTEQVQR